MIWYKWDGSKGIEGKSDTRGFIIIDGVNVGTLSSRISRGYFPCTETSPILVENQVRDAEMWSFANDAISKTWTVRDLTTEEIDQRTAGAMPLSEYWLWKALLLKGVITIEEAIAVLPTELIDAYSARDRLETP